MRTKSVFLVFSEKMVSPESSPVGWVFVSIDDVDWSRMVPDDVVSGVPILFLTSLSIGACRRYHPR